MKTYPSIVKFFGDSQDLYTFDKLDGSNLRFEWSKKRGWFKFGTRKRMFDETDPIFGVAVLLFMEQLSEQLERIVVNQRWQKVVVFAEFWGKESFAGLHVPEDEKFLTVIDASPLGKGILPPKEFLKYFEEFGPTYMGYLRWNKEFVESIRTRSNDLPITFEGVVGKTSVKNNIIMFKAKTQKWIDKVKERYESRQAQEIIDS
jgi:hypothetical protein